MGRHQGYRKPWGGGNKNGHERISDGNRSGRIAFHCGGGGTFHQQVFSSRPGETPQRIRNHANAYPLGAGGGHDSATHEAIGATSYSQHQHRRQGRGQARGSRRGGKRRGKEAAVAVAAGRMEAEGADETTRKESLSVITGGNGQAHHILGQPARSDAAGVSSAMPSAPPSCGGGSIASTATARSAAATSNESAEGADGRTAATKEGEIQVENEAEIIASGLARHAANEIGLPEEGQLCSESQIRPHLTWQRACKIGPGFVNLGNTCYLNSVLQCLSYLPPMAQYLLNGRYSQASKKTAFALSSAPKGSADSSDNGVLGAMQRLIEQVHQAGSTATQQTVRPTFFSRNVRFVCGKFRRGRQEDAHEFLRHLVNSMAGAYLDRKELDAVALNKRAETTPYHRIFGGYLRSQLKCMSCGHCSDKYESFMDLSLDLQKMGRDGRMTNFRSLHAALKRFTATETLGAGNEWECGGCEKLVEASKTLSVFKPPNALVIQLKRFGFAGATAKIKGNIHFEEKLDLDVSGPEGRAAYDLTGVVVHAGSSTSCGHYVAYVRSSDGWAKMNDEVVTPVKLDTVLKDEAYVLFYKRRPASPSPAASVPASSSSTSDAPSTKAASANGPSPTSGGGDGPSPFESKRSRKRRRKQERAAASAAAATTAAATTKPAALASAAAAAASAAWASAAAAAGATAETAVRTAGAAETGDELPGESPSCKKLRLSRTSGSAEDTNQSVRAVKVPPPTPALIPERSEGCKDDRSGGKRGSLSAAKSYKTGEGIGATPTAPSPSTSPSSPPAVVPSADATPSAVVGKRSREDEAPASTGAPSPKLRRPHSCANGCKSANPSSSPPSSPPNAIPLSDAGAGAGAGKRSREDVSTTETEAGASGLPCRTPKIPKVDRDIDMTPPPGAPSASQPVPSVVEPPSGATPRVIAGKRSRQEGSTTETEMDASDLLCRAPKLPRVDGDSLSHMHSPGARSVSSPIPSVVRPSSHAVPGMVPGRRSRQDRAETETESDVSAMKSSKTPRL